MTGIHIDTIYKSEAFSLLAQGMKDREAIAIVYSLMATGKEIFAVFERWAKEQLLEQEHEISEHRAAESKRGTEEDLTDNHRRRFNEAYKAIFNDDPTDIFERATRFGEEALELLQSCGISGKDVIELVRYVYGRPVGYMPQEIGGVYTTLYHLAHVIDTDFFQCANAGLCELESKIDKIRAKRATRRGRGPLPGYDPEISEPCPVEPDFVTECSEPVSFKFPIGTPVRKIKGSSWNGTVVGYYSTRLTPVGYAVESSREPGSVQIYPEAALEADALKPFDHDNLPVQDFGPYID